MKNIFIFFAIFLISCNSNNSRSFNFTYSVNVDSTNGAKLELWIPIPTTNEVQLIENLNISTDNLAYTIEKDETHGNSYVYINEKNGTKDTKFVEISFDVHRKERQNVDFKNVNPNKYLTSSSMVPTGAIFTKIIAENKLSNMNMRGIYDYVLSGMHYGKPTDDKDNPNYKYVYGGVNKNTGKEWLPKDITYGRLNVNQNMLVEKQNQKEGYAYGNGNSLYACDIGVGNCTDYHSYFISLGRTLEVPVRFHMGFPIPKGESGKVKGYHCWADYYSEGEGWYPVDISEADKAPEKADYFFGTICQNRVDMVVGRDIKLKGLESEFTNLFIYPIMEVNDLQSSSFEKSFSFKNI